MYIQPIFNECKAATNISSYFSKAEDGCSEVMKQAAKESCENNLNHYQKMRAVAKTLCQ